MFVSHKLKSDLCVLLLLEQWITEADAVESKVNPPVYTYISYANLYDLFVLRRSPYDSLLLLLLPSLLPRLSGNHPQPTPVMSHSIRKQR